MVFGKDFLSNPEHNILPLSSPSHNTCIATSGAVRLIVSLQQLIRPIIRQTWFFQYRF